MITTLATARPTYHALNGTQPIGQTQVATSSEYAGSVTTVTRENQAYWVVNVRASRNAFNPAKRQQGKTVTIWFDSTEGRYVADYWANMPGIGIVEAGRARALRAAIGVAVTVATRRWRTGR